MIAWMLLCIWILGGAMAMYYIIPDRYLHRLGCFVFGEDLFDEVDDATEE